MFVVAGVSLQDLEYFTETLLEDDRFLLLAPTLRVEMERRRVFSVALPVSVWEALANLVRKVPGLCAWGLRHLVFKTKWIALGYLEYNGFRQLQRYPLQLTQGDVEENITDLLATVETLDSETEKIKVCARVDRVQAIDGVQMMAHMACSTGLSEKRTWSWISFAKATFTN